MEHLVLDDKTTLLTASPILATVQSSSGGSAAERLLARAWKEAEELRHDWVGSEHFFLALLRPADESQAAGVLRGCGLTHERFAEELVRLIAASATKAKRASDRKSQHLNPAAYRMMGRAEGIAAGLGGDQVDSEHVLLAIIWDPYTLTETILTRLAVEREDIVKRLAAGGAPVPAAPLPRAVGWRWGEEVYVPISQLDALMSELPGLLPPGTPFGFNQDRKRGWLVVGEGVDLRTYVTFALDAWERGRLPCDCCRFVTLDREAPAGKRRCGVCYWLHDPVQFGDWTYRGGANEINLTEARANFVRFGACEARFRGRVRRPKPEEFPPWRASMQ